MFNKFIGIGNLTKDPILRYTSNNIPIATLSIAFNSRYSQKGETKEETFFADAVVFGKQAENCEQYLSKGSPVLVEGRLRESKWEHEGKSYKKIEIVTSTIEFLPKREKEINKKTGNISLKPKETSDISPF